MQRNWEQGNTQSSLPHSIYSLKPDIQLSFQKHASDSIKTIPTKKAHKFSFLNSVTTHKRIFTKMRSSPRNPDSECHQKQSLLSFHIAVLKRGSRVSLKPDDIRPLRLILTVSICQEPAKSRSPNPTGRGILTVAPILL